MYLVLGPVNLNCRVRERGRGVSGVTRDWTERKWHLLTTLVSGGWNGTRTVLWALVGRTPFPHRRNTVYSKGTYLCRKGKPLLSVLKYTYTLLTVPRFLFSSFTLGFTLLTVPVTPLPRPICLPQVKTFRNLSWNLIPAGNPSRPL